MQYTVFGPVVVVRTLGSDQWLGHQWLGHQWLGRGEAVGCPKRWDVCWCLSAPSSSGTGARLALPQGLAGVVGLLAGASAGIWLIHCVIMWTALSSISELPRGGI